MKVLGIIAAVVLGLAGLWMFNFPSATKRVRLTVEVETPEGVKSGSSVSELRFALGWPPMAGYHGLSVSESGEAVIVDLGQRGTIYALMCGRDRQGLPDNGRTRIDMFTESFKVRSFEGVGDKKFIAAVDAAKGKASVSARAFPLLVRFKDEDDPKSVEALDPENLAARFGAGVKLKGVTIETTNDPMTTGIEKRLGWLDRLERYQSDPKNPFTNTLPKEIGAFSSRSPHKNERL